MGSGRVLCPSAAQRLECGAARIDGGTGKVLFNAQQLVVLSHAVRAAHRAGLDLTRIETHGNIRDRAVFRLAGAVRNDGRVSRALGHIDGFERLRKRADLIDLHQN